MKVTKCDMCGKEYNAGVISRNIEIAEAEDNGSDVIKAKNVSMNIAWVVFESTPGEPKSLDVCLDCLKGILDRKAFHRNPFISAGKP